MSGQGGGDDPDRAADAGGGETTMEQTELNHISEFLMNPCDCGKPDCGSVLLGMRDPVIKDSPDGPVCCVYLPTDQIPSLVKWLLDHKGPPTDTDSAESNVETQSPRWLDVRRDLYSDDEAATLICPVCGSDYSHVFRVYSRCCEDEGRSPYWGTKGEWGNAGWRRAGLVVVLEGECEHWWRLVIQQHKGNNYFLCEVLTEDEIKQEQCVTEGEHTMKHTTELYLENGKTAIRTQANTEAAFLSDITPLLIGIVEKFGDNPKERETRISAWLTQSVDVCCKLRGYKSDVDEERVLIAGDRLLTTTPILSAESGELAP